jgi:transcriptional regulator with XRE-family HTH domain
MGRKVRPALLGLEAMGVRLKQIRTQSGLSQMKLAKLIGFDPAHGYKYILRLEKGQVPNPTLRTIAACLEACGAKWEAIADVLPNTGTVAAPGSSSIVHRPSSIIQSPDPRPQSLTPIPTPLSPQSRIENQKSEIPAPPRRKDSRPMREQLRSRRIEEHELHARRFWSGTKQAVDATVALLHSLRIPSSLHRASTHSKPPGPRWPSANSPNSFNLQSRRDLTASCWRRFSRPAPRSSTHNPTSDEAALPPAAAPPRRHRGARSTG